MCIWDSAYSREPYFSPTVICIIDPCDFFFFFGENIRWLESGLVDGQGGNSKSFWRKVN